MTAENTSTITDTVTITETSALPLDDSSDFPPFEDGGDGSDRSCFWEDDLCTEVPTHYIISYCNDPNCTHTHTKYYCQRHYAMTLKDIVDHIPHCSACLAAHTPDERIEVVARHIAGFGPIAQN